HRESKHAVERMNAALHHRGPDDRGIFEYQSKTRSTGFISVCLGNTRLAILDTSRAGHQPMVDENTGICLTYNGETYNFNELKSEIGDQFGPWSSKTDTEVVLRAYRKWGIAAFQRLRGMFALAIWDPVHHELILARDPFGIKPLYYFESRERDSARLIFASEVRAILASGLVARRLSADGVGSYLSCGSIQSPLTIVSGVKSVMPGECLVFHAGKTRWDVKVVSINNQPSQSMFGMKRESRLRLTCAKNSNSRYARISSATFRLACSCQAAWIRAHSWR